VCPVNQKSLHAYFAGGDLWAEIHLSKTPFRSGDEKLFSAILDTAKLNPDYTPNSMDYFVYGSLRYQDRDYKRAGEFYQQALEMEKREQKLERKYWKVLIDNLGMSYGLSHDLKRAKAVFEYGISQDATYPLFYYNLACTYGEMKDMDNAITYLRKAFQLRANVLPGESMPDPMRDDSFREFTRNPKFVAAVEQLPRS
jgi:tetratricopeptide (TPR) repeat protein